MVNAIIYLTGGEVLSIKNYKSIEDFDGNIMYFYDNKGRLQLAVNKAVFSHMVLEHKEQN